MSCWTHTRADVLSFKIPFKEWQSKCDRMWWVFKDPPYSFELPHVSNDFKIKKILKMPFQRLHSDSALKQTFIMYAVRCQDVAVGSKLTLVQWHFCQHDDAFSHFPCRAFYRTTQMKLCNILYVRYMQRGAYCRPSQATDSRRKHQPLGIDQRHFKAEADMQDHHPQPTSEFTCSLLFLGDVKNKTQNW